MARVATSDGASAHGKGSDAADPAGGDLGGDGHGDCGITKFELAFVLEAMCILLRHAIAKFFIDDSIRFPVELSWLNKIKVSSTRASFRWHGHGSLLQQEILQSTCVMVQEVCGRRWRMTHDLAKPEDTPNSLISHQEMRELSFKFVHSGLRNVLLLNKARSSAM